MSVTYVVFVLLTVHAELTVCVYPKYTIHSQYSTYSFLVAEVAESHSNSYLKMSGIKTWYHRPLWFCNCPCLLFLDQELH